MKSAARLAALGDAGTGSCARLHAARPDKGALWKGTLARGQGVLMSTLARGHSVENMAPKLG